MSRSPAVHLVVVSALAALVGCATAGNPLDVALCSGPVPARSVAPDAGIVPVVLSRVHQELATTPNGFLLQEEYDDLWSPEGVLGRQKDAVVCSLYRGMGTTDDPALRAHFFVGAADHVVLSRRLPLFLAAVDEAAKVPEVTFQQDFLARLYAALVTLPDLTAYQPLQRLLAARYDGHADSGVTAAAAAIQLLLATYAGDRQVVERKGRELVALWAQRDGAVFPEAPTGTAIDGAGSSRGLSGLGAHLVAQGFPEVGSALLGKTREAWLRAYQLRPVADTLAGLLQYRKDGQTDLANEAWLELDYQLVITALAQQEGMFPPGLWALLDDVDARLVEAQDAYRECGLRVALLEAAKRQDSAGQNEDQMGRRQTAVRKGIFSQVGQLPSPWERLDFYHRIVQSTGLLPEVAPFMAAVADTQSYDHRADTWSPWHRHYAWFARARQVAAQVLPEAGQNRFDELLIASLVHRLSSAREPVTEIRDIGRALSQLKSAGEHPLACFLAGSLATAVNRLKRQGKSFGEAAFDVQLALFALYADHGLLKLAQDLVDQFALEGLSFSVCTNPPFDKEDVGPGKSRLGDYLKFVMAIRHYAPAKAAALLGALFTETLRCPEPPYGLPTGCEARVYEFVRVLREQGQNDAADAYVGMLTAMAEESFIPEPTECLTQVPDTTYLQFCQDEVMSDLTNATSLREFSRCQSYAQAFLYGLDYGDQKILSVAGLDQYRQAMAAEPLAKMAPPQRTLWLLALYFEALDGDPHNPLGQCLPTAVGKGD